jgi:uncharacterized protein
MHVDNSKVDLTFNVAQLLREDTGGRRNYTFHEDVLRLDETLDLRQIEGSVKFTRTSSGVLADVAARGLVALQCSRCLSPVEQPISIRFRDEFHSRVEVNTGVPLPQPDEDDPFFISEAHMIDLGEAIREYALLELPMQVLCKDDCKGLCPTCGADLNAGLCGCSNDEGDERFAALRSLLDR